MPKFHRLQPQTDFLDIKKALLHSKIFHDLEQAWQTLAAECPGNGIGLISFSPLHLIHFINSSKYIQTVFTSRSFSGQLEKRN